MEQRIVIRSVIGIYCMWEKESTSCVSWCVCVTKDVWTLIYWMRYLTADKYEGGVWLLVKGEYTSVTRGHGNTMDSSNRNTQTEVMKLTMQCAKQH